MKVILAKKYKWKKRNDVIKAQKSIRILKQKK